MNFLFLAASNPVEHVVDKPIHGFVLPGGHELTMHVMNMIVVAVLLVITLVAAARAIGTGPESSGWLMPTRRRSPPRTIGFRPRENSSTA